LAIEGQTGFEEAKPEIETVESGERRRIRESMQKHKEELLKDDRIKPTVVLPMQEGTCGSHEARRSPDLQEEEDSEWMESPPPPAVIPEARQAIRMLEIIAAEKAKLDERDERRRIAHEEIQAKIHRPPLNEETVAITMPKKKKPPNSDAAKSKAKKSEDGKAKQAKAEQRTKKGKP
jgi:hypothetical protein